MPHDSKFFTPLTLRIAAFYAGFLHVEGERHLKHAVHRGVHLYVHLGDSSNSRNEKQLNTRHGEFWARAKHRSGLERPRLSLHGAPKGSSGVVPAHSFGFKASRLHTLTP